MAQQRFAEAEAEVEARSWEKRNSYIAFQEINQELESQRFQVHQASRWADQAQRGKISRYRKLEKRNRLFQENHATDWQEIEELGRICCEESDRARQARTDELSMHQEMNPTTDGSDSGISEKNHYLMQESFLILNQGAALERPTFPIELQRF